MHTATESTTESIMELNSNVLQVIPPKVTDVLTRYLKTV